MLFWRARILDSRLASRQASPYDKYHQVRRLMLAADIIVDG